MSLDVRIDRELCIGAENCVRYAANTFYTDDAGKASLRSELGDSDETVSIAVSSCPVGALSISTGAASEGD